MPHLEIPALYTSSSAQSIQRFFGLPRDRPLLGSHLKYLLHKNLINSIITEIVTCAWYMVWESVLNIYCVSIKSVLNVK